MTRRRMPPEDSLWLELDRPTNQMVITSVLWTDSPVDPERLREVLRRRVLSRYPVFPQRPVVHSGLVRRGVWVDDPEFDLDRHLVVQPMPGPGGRAALQDFVAAQRSNPLDPGHPLWRVHLLQGYAGGSALVQRYHHAMADGIRLTQVMLALLDPLDDGEVSLTAQAGGRMPVGGLPGIAGAGLALLHTGVSALKIALWTGPGQPGSADRGGAAGPGQPLRAGAGGAAARARRLPRPARRGAPPDRPHPPLVGTGADRGHRPGSRTHAHRRRRGVEPGAGGEGGRRADQRARPAAR